MLFKEEWGVIGDRNTDPGNAHPSDNSTEDEENDAVTSDNTGRGQYPEIDISAARKGHATVKKTIPLFMGLATGFAAL